MLDIKRFTVLQVKFVSKIAFIFLGNVESIVVELAL